MKQCFWTWYRHKYRIKVAYKDYVFVTDWTDLFKLKLDVVIDNMYSNGHWFVLTSNPSMSFPLYFRYNEKKVDIFSICTRPVQILCGLLLIVSLATLLVTLVVGRSVTPPLEPTYPASSSAQYSRAAVVTDDVTCSQIGTWVNQAK